MSIKRCNFVSNTFAAMGVLVGILLVAPAVHAGDAMMLVPEEDRDVPEGSQIPEHRVKEMEKKVADLKAKMRAEARKQQQERAVQSQSPRPENKNP